MATFIPYLVAFKLVEYDHEYKCVRQWMRVFDDSSSVTKYFMALFIAFFLYSLRSDVYSISCDFFETEVPERTRRTLNERSNSALEKGEKCAEAFHCYCVRVRCMLDSIQYFCISTYVCR